VIPESITKKLREFGDYARRPPEEVPEVIECLEELELMEHEQLREFFSEFDMEGVRSVQLVELMDLVSPGREVAETTFWARDMFELGDDFICLTNGEGEYFILYSKRDRKVYGVGIEEIEALERGAVAPRWESFYDLLEWYLADARDDE
jgi:hypothetical protein